MMTQFNFILTGGRVLDPAQQIDAVMDVAFSDAKVAEIAQHIDVPKGCEYRDVSGHIVTPGLIDMHTHVYWGGTSLSVEADRFAEASAITTLIDTGSAGPGNFPGFRKFVIDQVETRVLAYLHISHAGIYGFSNRVMVGESENLQLMDPITAVEVAKDHPGVIIGIKVRLGRWTSGSLGVAPFHYALDAAEAAGLPLMVHIDEAPPSYEEVVSLLRPGDVLTHCFKPFPNIPLTGDGKVKPEVLAARDRGVFFDIAHGMGSFGFDVARGMLAEGFLPDTISTDIHTLCIEGPVFDLPTTLSKFLCLGISLNEVIRAATETPAKILKREDLGSLRSGAAGDASILRLEEGEFDYIDSAGVHMTGAQRLSAVGSVMAGRWRDA